jgi:GT2 family glycosyltransferase
MNEIEEGDQVIVVDNASRDESAERIAVEFPEVELVRSERNLGFGRANNLAFARTRGKYVWLLNTDTLVLSGATEAMIGVLQCEPDVGAVGCRLENPDGTLQRSCWTFPSPAAAWSESLGLNRLRDRVALPGVPRDWHRWAHDAEADVDFVIGASLMVRRRVIEEIGGFDENFFLYAEETDWQRRMQAAGWRVRFTPAGTVVHLGGASGAGMRDRQLVEFCRATARYVRKHHGRLGLAAVRAAKLVGLTLRLPTALASAVVGNPGATDRLIDRTLHLRWWLGFGPYEGIAELELQDERTASSAG